MRGRLSIRAAMGLVLLVALASAALRSASEVWVSLAFTATLGLLGVAALGAMFRRGPARAFHAGATAFGLAYLLLTFGPWSIEHIRPRLLTARLFDAAYPAAHPSGRTPLRIWGVRDGRTLVNVAFSPEGGMWALSGPDGSGSPRQVAAAAWLSFVGTGASPSNFHDIGHSLAALLGGLVAHRFHTTGDRVP